jgi:hypothetical protein
MTAALTNSTSGEILLGLKRWYTVAVMGHGIRVVGDVGFASRKGIIVKLLYLL